MIGIVAKKKPNWDAIKAEYLRGGTSYRKLAAKHGVSFSTLEKRARRESWDAETRQIGDTVATELPRRIAETILSEAERITRRHFDIWDKFLTLAEAKLNGSKQVVTKEGAVFDVEFIENARDIKEWALGVKAATEGQRLAAGIIDPNKVKADPNAAPDDDEEGPKHGVLIMPMKDELPDPPPEPAGDDQEEECGD